MDKRLKVVYFDIEVASIGDRIGADQGFILCAAFKTAGEKKVRQIGRAHV